MISIFCSIVFGFLLIRFFVTLYNAITQPILPQFKNQNFAESDLRTKISILIPARNESKNIGNLLDNLLIISDLIFFNYEIIVLNDHSSDNTQQIVEGFLHQNLNLRLIIGQDLPQKWLGKNWACHQLAMNSTGDFLLFLDADVSLKDGAVINAIQRLKEEHLDLLSLFPEQKMQTFGEQTIVPLMHFLLLNLLPLRLVRTSSFASLSAANGQFMLFDAANYRKYLFHEKVKSNILDDVNIMRIIKLAMLNGEVLLGNGQVYCRMYSSGNEAFKGFSKNLFLGFDKNIVGFQLYFLFIFWLWIPFFIFADWRWSLLSVVLILSQRAMISQLSNQDTVKNLLFHPLQMVVYVCIGINSMYLHLFNKVQWKGRKV
ncbi:MAG: glycosyltransferase [Cytophagales bacterium]